MDVNNSSSNVTCDPLTEGEIELYTRVSWWVDGLLEILVGSIGLLANGLAIPILLSRAMNTIFNKLLVFLAICDNFFIVCSMLEGIRKHSDFWQIHEYAFGYFLYPLHNFVLCCSIYVTLALALERYRAVWRPVEYHNKCKGANPWRRVASYVIPVFAFSAVFNIPKLFEVEFVVKSEMHEADNSCNFVAHFDFLLICCLCQFGFCIFTNLASLNLHFQLICCLCQYGFYILTNLASLTFHFLLISFYFSTIWQIWFILEVLLKYRI